MSVRPPSFGRRPEVNDPLGLLNHEIAAEQVASLSHAARRLETALERLAAAEDGERDALLADAGEALWFLAVQREAMGLRNTAQLMRDYRVPKAVQLRMGLRPKPKAE